MARYARINSTTQAVEEVFEGNIKTAFHPSIQAAWIKVPASVEVGMIRNGEGGFDPAPELEVPEDPIPVDNPNKEFSPVDFMDLFKPEEEIAIRLAAKEATPEGVAMEMFLDRVKNVSFIRLDDPRVTAGLAALKTAGIISEARRKKIAAGAAPS